VRLTENQIAVLTALADRALPSDAIAARLGPASVALIGLHKDGLVAARITQRGTPLFMITDKGRNRLALIAATPGAVFKPPVITPAPTPAPTPIAPKPKPKPEPKSAIELRFSSLDLDDEPKK
jgi:hypothetical protein